VGKDPRHIEDLWSVMYRGGFYRGGPILMSAIAGIDQALWDIKGKDLGQPVHQLLGGPVRDRIRVYSWIGGDRGQYDFGGTGVGHSGGQAGGGATTGDSGSGKRVEGL
jgi:L-alanine-DL-glutamate epimerase-like enolase superfamily enzyme